MIRPALLALLVAASPALAGEYDAQLATLAHDRLKAVAQDNLAKLDTAIASQDFICGDRYTMADAFLYAILDFGSGVGQPLDPALANVGTWFERMGARPSSEASLHPVAAAGGMRA